MNYAFEDDDKHILCRYQLKLLYNFSVGLCNLSFIIFSDVFLCWWLMTHDRCSVVVSAEGPSTRRVVWTTTSRASPRHHLGLSRYRDSGERFSKVYITLENQSGNQGLRRWGWILKFSSVWWQHHVNQGQREYVLYDIILCISTYLQTRNLVLVIDFKIY